MISWSIKAQIKEVSILLLRIDKNKVHNCMKDLSKIALNLNQQEGASQEFSLGVKKRVQKISINSWNESDQVGYSLNDKKVKDRHKVKKITDLQNSGRSSYFSRPANTRFKKTMLKLAITILLMMTPRVANFAYLLNSYHLVSRGFERMYVITAASQSIHTVQAFYYRDYRDMFKNGKIYRTEDETWIQTNSQEQFNGLLTIDDQFIRSRLDKYRLCDYAVKNLASTLLTYRREFENFCRFVTRFRPNITLLETYHVMQNYHQRVGKLLNDTSLMVGLSNFYESQDTAFVDGASYYLTVALRSIGQEYLKLVSSSIENNQDVSLSISIVSILLILLMILIYKQYFLKKRLRKWKILKGCFQILNNALVNNEYIKCYFRYKADRQIEETEYENFFRDY